MKIENGYNKYLQSIQQTNKNVSAKKADNSTEPKQEKSVQVNISAEAKRLSEATQSTHSQRVEDIKKAIQNNTYEVSPEDISKGLLKAIRGQKGKN